MVPDRFVYILNEDVSFKKYVVNKLKKKFMYGLSCKKIKLFIFNKNLGIVHILVFNIIVLCMCYHKK